MKQINLQQHLKDRLQMPVAEFAKKLERSERRTRDILVELGISKTRDEYEATAKIRRKMAYDLRQEGLSWREVAKKMGCTICAAQALIGRYKKMDLANNQDN